MARRRSSDDTTESDIPDNPAGPATEVAAPAPPAESALVQAFKAARRCSTPLVGIETPDPASTVNTVTRVLPSSTPLLAWDAARGLRGLNAVGVSAMKKLEIEQALTVNAAEALLACESLPEPSVIFAYNLHLQLRDASGHPQPAVVQALWNLRDSFKLNKRMVIILGPTITLPSELTGDVILLDEPLPTRTELDGLLLQQFTNAGLPAPPDEEKEAALDAMVGLPHFTAEQVTAMSLEKTGLNIGKLWQRKIKAIEATDGLRVWQARPGDTTIDELKGIDTVVEFMREFIAADAFGCVVFMDEMDKAFAGGMSDHTGDSGVSKDQVGQVLSYIEDEGHHGVMLAGCAGTGKSQLAKGVGAASGKPVILFDLGGMKAGIVGESERKIRAGLKVITATAEGRVLFIGTANRTTIFTPEMNRRFPDQFFYDTPDDAARVAMWEVYVRKNGLTASQSRIPPGFDAGWTGAEIKRACERAALFGKPVVDVAKYIIPMAISGRAAIDQLRRAAHGRFLSASYDGLYQMPVDGPPAQTRKIEVN